MSWREEAFRASFRGVSFYTRSRDAVVGRRNVVHEYPVEDVPFVEDIGRSARRYPVTGFVWGDDVYQQRDALQEAFEAEGPGELIHPDYGTLLVALDGQARLSFSATRGGMCEFSLTFVEAGEPLLPALTITPIEAAREVTAAANRETRRLFDAALWDDLAEMTRIPDWGLADLALDVATFVGAGVQFLKSLPPLGPLPAVQIAVKSFEDAGAYFAGLTTSTRPSASPLQNAVFSIAAAGAGNSSVGLANAFGRFSTFGDSLPDIPATGTPQRAAFAEARGATVAVVRVAALGEQVRAFARGGIPDPNDVAEVSRDFHAAYLRGRETLSEIGDVEAYRALRALHALGIRVLRDLSFAATPTVDHFVSGANETTLHLAYRYLGDATRAEEIEAMNRNVISHPGFLPQGVIIRVPTQ